MPTIYTQPEIINSGDTLQLPDGDVDLLQPIIVINKEKIRIKGGKGTRLFYRGGPAIGAIQFHGVRKGSIGGPAGAGFEIIAAVDGCEAGIVLTNSTIVGGYIMSAIITEDVHVRHGGHPTCFKKGMSVDSYVGDPTKIKGGSNNENHWFKNCTIESCSIAGFHIKGHQAHDIVFERCAGYDAVGRRPYGVWCEEGSFFKWINGSAFQTRCDFQCDWPATFVNIDGHNSEHSNQLLSNIYRDDAGTVTRAATSSRFFCNIQNIRWDGEPIKGNKKPVVDFWGRGSLVMTSCYICGINGITPRIETNNYSAFVGGALVPLPGSINLNSVAIRQHGGRVEMSNPIIKTPYTWNNAAHGIEHEYVNADGSMVYRTLKVNQILEQTT